MYCIDCSFNFYVASKGIEKGYFLLVDLDGSKV